MVIYVPPIQVNPSPTQTCNTSKETFLFFNPAFLQVQEYKYEIERLSRDLQDVKKKYFMQKKKEHQSKEKERAYGVSVPSGLTGGVSGGGATGLGSEKNNDGPRFTGGGFNLRQAPPTTKVTS